MTLDMETLQPDPGEDPTPPPGRYTSEELDQARAALDRRELVRVVARRALQELRVVLPPRLGEQGLQRAVLILEELGGGP